MSPILLRRGSPRGQVGTHPHDECRKRCFPITREDEGLQLAAILVGVIGKPPAIQIQEGIASNRCRAFVAIEKRVIQGEPSDQRGCLRDQISAFIVGQGLWAIAAASSARRSRRTAALPVCCKIPSFMAQSSSAVK